MIYQNREDEMGNDRFFIEHGVIHDRQTGRHVAADFEPDWQDRLLALLNGTQDAHGAERELRMRAEREVERLRKIETAAREAYDALANLRVAHHPEEGMGTWVAELRDLGNMLVSYASSDE